MRRRWFLLAAIALAIAPLGSAGAGATAVLVELFTSEGCSSCPPADRLLATLIDTPIAGSEVIGLSEHVDYWDALGWKDRFSSIAMTNRQRRYAQIFNIDSIYTPQMVVDGRAELVGGDASAARNAIMKAIAAPHATIAIGLEHRAADRIVAGISVTDVPKVSRGDHAEILVAVTESELRSDVRGGENRGRLLTHAAVVRQMAIVGEAASGEAHV